MNHVLGAVFEDWVSTIPTQSQNSVLRFEPVVVDTRTKMYSRRSSLVARDKSGWVDTFHYHNDGSGCTEAYHHDYNAAFHKRHLTLLVITQNNC